MSSVRIIGMLALLASLQAPALSAEEPSVQLSSNANIGESRPSTFTRVELDDHVHKAEENGQAGLEIPEQSVVNSEAAMNPAEPLLVTRNSSVTMEYAQGRLTIQTEGRALSQGHAGELVRIMNLNSKSIVAATVIGPSKVIVK